MDGFTACPVNPHPPAQFRPCEGRRLFVQIHRQPGGARRQTAMRDPRVNKGLNLNGGIRDLRWIWLQPAFALM